MGLTLSGSGAGRHRGGMQKEVEPHENAVRALLNQGADGRFRARQCAITSFRVARAPAVSALRR